MKSNLSVEGRFPEKEEVKQSVKPLRPLSAYIYFANYYIPIVRKELGIGQSEGMKKAGERWKSLTEAEKAPYQKMNDESIER